MDRNKKWSELVYWLTIKPRLWSLQKLLPEAKIHPAGSRYVCDPPVLGTDIDFLIYTRDSIDHILFGNYYKKSNISEYAYPCNHEDACEFQAWRRRKVNLIVTSSIEYAESFHTATHICKTWNFKHKGDRVCVHEMLRTNQPIQHLYWVEPKGELLTLLTKLTGTYGKAMQKAYRVKHKLEGFV